MASKMNPGFMAMMAKKKEGMHKMPDGKMMKDSAMKKMASGGMPMKMKDGKEVPAFLKNGGMSKMMASGGMPKALKAHAAKPASKAHAGLKSGGMAKMAKGGGIESRGKTKGKII